MGFYSKEFSGFLFVFDGLYFIQWITLIFFIKSPSLYLYMVVDAISANIDKVLSIKPPASVFVFKYFDLESRAG